MLGNFACFLLSDDFFSKLTFSNNSFRNTITVSNSLIPDQAFVGPVFKSYHQIPPAGKELRQVNISLPIGSGKQICHLSPHLSPALNGPISAVVK